MSKFPHKKPPVAYLVYVSGIPDGVRKIPHLATKNALVFVRQSTPFASQVKRVVRPAKLQSIITKHSS